MNQLKPSTVCIPVSVDEELPPYPQIVTVLIDSRIPMMAQIRPSENGHEWWTLGMGSATRIEEKKKCVTHWLKNQSLYIFTKEELEKIINDAWEAGHKPFVNKPKLSYVKQLLP